MANGANPIAIIVPCHRVIGSNGSLTGFGGGIPTKRARRLSSSSVIEERAHVVNFRLLGFEVRSRCLRSRVFRSRH